MRSLMALGSALVFLAAGCSGVKTEPATGGGGDISITEVIPAQGPLAGGVPIQIKGSGFTEENLLVTFGGSTVNDAEVVSSTTISGTLPPRSQPAVVDIVVACAAGQATLEDGFEYREGSAINITGLTPNNGPLSGGTTVTITGAGFDAGTTSVKFGQGNGTGVNVLSDAQLTVLTPATATNGAVAVAVTNENGTAQLPNAYVYGTVGGGGTGGQTTTESLGGIAELNRMLVENQAPYSAGQAFFFAASNVLYPVNNSCTLDLDQFPSVASTLDAGNSVTLTQSSTSLSLPKNTSTPNFPTYLQNNGPANGFSFGQMAGVSAPGAAGVAAFTQASVAAAPSGDYGARMNLFFDFTGGAISGKSADLWLDWDMTFTANHVQIYLVGQDLMGGTHVLQCDVRGADSGSFCIKGGAPDDMCQTPGATIAQFFTAIDGPAMGMGVANVYLYRGNRSQFTLPGGAKGALNANVTRVSSVMLQ